jgi:hypothetical protein
MRCNAREYLDQVVAAAASIVLGEYRVSKCQVITGDGHLSDHNGLYWSF